MWKQETNEIVFIEVKKDFYVKVKDIRTFGRFDDDVVGDYPHPYFVYMKWHHPADPPICLKEEEYRLFLKNIRGETNADAQRTE